MCSGAIPSARLRPRTRPSAIRSRPTSPLPRDGGLRCCRLLFPLAGPTNRRVTLVEELHHDVIDVVGILPRLAVQLLEVLDAPLLARRNGSVRAPGTCQGSSNQMSAT